MDRADVDRHHGMRAQPVKPEVEAAVGSENGVELAPDAVAPGVLHPEHRRVGRQAQAGARPGVLDDAPLEGELAFVSRVLEVAAAALAVLRAPGLDPVGRGLQDVGRAREADPGPPPPRLGLHRLARQRVVDEYGLALLAGDHGAAVGGRLGPQDQRRQKSVGSLAGLTPAASTSLAAAVKPAAIFEGSWASLPKETARPPSSRHQPSTTGPGQRPRAGSRPRVVFTSRTASRRAAALNTARYSSS